MPQPSSTANEVQKKYRLLTMDTPNHQQYTASSDKTYNQIRCLQINLQHSRSATDNLMNIIEKDEIGIIFSQELYLCRNTYVGINKSTEYSIQELIKIDQPL